MGISPESTVIDFIGTGVRGKSMASHLVKAGNALHVHSRTREKARTLEKNGAIWNDSPAALAPFCDVVITMVGYPADVEDVYLGKNGLLNHLRPGTL